MKKIRFLSVLLIALGLSSCLRTRAQLKEDGDDSAPTKPQQAQVQDAQPQGGYALDEIKSEMTRMNGRIEDLERAKGQSPTPSPSDVAASNDRLTKLETRMTEMEQAQAAMIEAIKKMQSTAAAGTPAADPVELFDKAKIQLDGGDNVGAIESFTNYLKASHPSRTEEATYLRGDAFYNDKQYKKAIIDYSKFTDKFAKSKRSPAAMYKIGLSFEALGMKQDARDFFADLVEKYPKSQEAKKAKAKLK